MSYYFIAQIKIINEKEYKKYTDKVSDVVAKYNGTYQAVDTNPVVLEGQWDYGRCVIIEFNSKEDFEHWYNSQEYRKILSVRVKASQSIALLVKGLENKMKHLQVIFRASFYSPFNI